MATVCAFPKHLKIKKKRLDLNLIYRESKFEFHL